MADRQTEAGPGRQRPAPGPFEGYQLGVTDVPVRVFDLAPDGCLVELSFGTLDGRPVRLQIELPGEGWIVVPCEMVHSAGHNTFAVKFVRLDEPTRLRIERTMNRQSD